MGRRKKAAKKVVKKKKPEVPKVFKCLFCNHEEAVDCKLETKSMLGPVHSSPSRPLIPPGYLTCRICGASFQTTITTLTEPIGECRLHPPPYPPLFNLL